MNECNVKYQMGEFTQGAQTMNMNNMGRMNNYMARNINQFNSNQIGGNNQQMVNMNNQQMMNANQINPFNSNINQVGEMNQMGNMN